MQINMSTHWRRWAVCGLIAIASAAVTEGLSAVRFFQLLNLKALDAHFVLRGKTKPSNIVLFVADQKAMDTFSELRLFWHSHYAEAIQAAAQNGAKVIGLDLAFGVPVDKWEPDLDRVLGEAVSTSPVPVVCGYVATLNTNQESLPVPINMLAAALGLAGFTNMTADPDDFLRNQELFEAPRDAQDTQMARSLSLRIVEKFLGTDAEFKDGRLLLAGKPVPITTDRSIQINYVGPPDTFPRVSLADVIAAARAGNRAQLRQWVDGKIVLVGTDSVDDRFATPFYTLFSGPRWTTAGVEIHANTIQTLLEGNFLLPVPGWVRAAGLLIAAAITAFIATSAAAGMAAVWLLAVGTGILGLTHSLFLEGRILSTSEMLTAATICLIGSIAYRFATAEKRRDLFRSAVSLFVGKQVAASLDVTETIGLTGKRITATILFTDIRGFTAFTERVCEEQGPEKVVQLLNDYMALMVSIILKYQGHVNKFIGDGILAVFSDDDEGAITGDHAERALRCAREMVNAPSDFKTGAGLHTGLVVVGNVGSADKMEYTVLGDTVNLASRLESLNKEHKTNVLLSDATYQLLKDPSSVALVGSVPVRGKAVPIQLYTVQHV